MALAKARGVSMGEHSELKEKIAFDEQYMYLTLIIMLVKDLKKLTFKLINMYMV